MKKFYTLFIVSFLSLSTFAQTEKVDVKLNKMINELVKGFNGDVGIYVKSLKTGKVATFNADTIFPTASMIKVPITCGIFDKIEKGEFAFLVGASGSRKINPYKANTKRRRANIRKYNYKWQGYNIFKT